MSSPKILKESPISMVMVKEDIGKIRKRDKELSYRMQRTEEYVNQFVKDDAKKLLDTLKKLDIPRLKEEHIVKIVDLLPRSVDDLKIILQGYTITLTKENINKIVEEVNKFSD